MSTFEFKTPVSEEDIKKVHIGDVIYLTGDIVTGRDDVHHRVVISGKEPPVDLTHTTSHVAALTPSSQSP